MRRALAVVLVCCLLSGTAFAVADGAVSPSVAGVTPSPNTTGSLTVDPDALETASYRRATLDVSATLTLATRSLDGQFEQRVLDERANELDAASARRAQLNRSVARVETGIARLRARQTAAVRGYNNGTLTDREFVVELAYIDTAAGRLETAAGRVADRADSLAGAQIDGQPVDNWAQNRQVQLGALEGPVRERIAGALRGENTVRIENQPVRIDGVNATPTTRLEPLRVYVETTDAGVVLATVDDGTYLREASLPGERNNTTAGELTGIQDALDRVQTSYPWAWNHSSSTTSAGDRRAGIYAFTLYHDQGVLTTSLNRTSGRVFAEDQRIDLSSVPTATPVQNRTDDLRLQVNRTSPTGPLELSLSTADGEPADGRIAINNQSVGATGDDGQLWTVAPHENLSVTARTGEGVITVNTDATVGNDTAVGSDSTIGTDATAGTGTAAGTNATVGIDTAIGSDTTDGSNTPERTATVTTAVASTAVRPAEG
ncbi:DUF7096 domain-containing protein [Halococcus hamelinensis]|uniref:Uncharacterized protein n=1 Tax=Halococcus hamelinensis 100A6 TaxID=1132509 RepID=M0M5A8_9EURY|nr:hypothetical protein [Halococcus hamelinensis]EMA39540.1 hypothetical protein C447_06166 [Halococcus hamelinensis 100A6]